MKIDIKGIVQGITNSVFVKESVEDIAKQRLETCKQCPLYSPNLKEKGMKFTRLDAFCYKCSCNIYLKTRALSAACPEGKWPAITDDKTAEEIAGTKELKEELDDYKLKLMRNQITE